MIPMYNAAPHRNSITAAAPKLLLSLSPLLLGFATVGVYAQAAAPRSYYVEPGSYSTQRETDPPVYVRNVGNAYQNSLTWLDFGLEYRLRYEYRDDDLRRLDPNDTDQPLLQRTRAYVGIKDILDPLRLTVELTDSRVSASHYIADNRDVNKRELIQGYAELDFPDVLPPDPRGNARPLTVRGGRMAFEVLDRRLVARNEWRNTTNNFDGVRFSLGDDNNAWALEAWSLNPVTRLLDKTDHANHDINFNAVVTHWRAWSPVLTLEPHYFELKQNATAATSFRERHILAPGLRAYGRVLSNAVNYDVSVMQQHGIDGGQAVKAQSFTAEVGYSWSALAWKPRLSASYGYASGDQTPNDNHTERFERFFGFARPWSADDYVIFENVRAPKLRVEFQPLNGVRVDAGYHWYRLASNTDRFNNLLAGTAENRNRTGSSGNDMGTSWDLRMRFALAPHLQANIGYSAFELGEFTRQRQQVATGDSATDSDFCYVELTWRLFEG
jgi:hypothetical protein